MTLQEAKRRLGLWLEAEETIAIGGQEYETSGGRRLTRANLKEVRERINYYNRKIKALEGKTRKSYGVIPRDL